MIVELLDCIVVISEDEENKSVKTVLKIPIQQSNSHHTNINSYYQKEREIVFLF